MNNKSRKVKNLDDRKTSQGFVDLKNKTIEQLEELIERQNKILQNRFVLKKLPDKGEKIELFKISLEKELEKRKEEYNTTCKLFSSLTLKDSPLEDLEWNEGKSGKSVERLDSDDESDGEVDPLRLVATHSGTVKEQNSKISSTYSEKFCERYGQNTAKVRFKPNQLRDSSRNLFKTSAEKLKQRLGNKWEVTEATPPVPVFEDTVFITLSESLKLQKEQAQRMREMEKAQAAEKLLKNLSMKTKNELPVNNITEYRESRNDFDETVSEGEEEEKENESESDEKDRTVIYSMNGYESES